MTDAGRRLIAAVNEAREWVETLSPEDAEKLRKAQQDSWTRSIVDWPKPKYEWINGVKVYASYEDYCND